MLYWFFSIKSMYLRSILISFVEIVVAERYIVMSHKKRSEYKVIQRNGWIYYWLSVNPALQPNILISAAYEGWKMILYVTLYSYYCSAFLCFGYAFIFIL